MKFSYGFLYIIMCNPPFLLKSSSSSYIQVLFYVKSICCLVTILDILIIFVNKLKS